MIHHVSAKANDEGAACKATEVSPAHCFHSGFNSCHCIQGERMTHTQAATNTTLMVMLRLKKNDTAVMKGTHQVSCQCLDPLTAQQTADHILFITFIF